MASLGQLESSGYGTLRHIVISDIKSLHPLQCWYFNGKDIFLCLFVWVRVNFYWHL